MEDVLELYAEPYAEAKPVVRVDEKSKELHVEVRDNIPVAPICDALSLFVKQTSNSSFFVSSMGYLNWFHCNKGLGLCIS